MISSNKSTTSQRYKFLSAFLAFIIWGSWAFYINHGSGFKTQLVSGLTQGTASFIITLIMVAIITKIYNYLPDNPLRLLLPAVITISLTGTCLVLVHRLAGTPNIAFTVLPALTVAFIFSVFTTNKLENS